MNPTDAAAKVKNSCQLIREIFNAELSGAEGVRIE